ncbi:hypothetical protein ACKKBF_B12805 [Auxenochlorella protothecoides x Auxenochlorella symbiontica]
MVPSIRSLHTHFSEMDSRWLTGYPPWPAQVLPATAAAAHRGLQATKRVPQQTTAVMFFGDYTAAWLAGSQVQRWHEGLTATASKASKNKKLAAALAEAQLFVKHGRAPKGWWTETLVGRNVCKASSEAQASPGKPGGPSKQRKQTAPSVSLHTLAVVPRRVKKEGVSPVDHAGGSAPAVASIQAPTRVDAPVFDVIDGRLVTKAGLPLLTLKRRAGAAALTGKDALPSYLHLRSNAYHTPALKPRRLPPDQVDVCSCQPVARLPRRAALADDMPAAAVAAAVTAAALAPHLGSPPPSRRGGCGPDCLNRLSLTLCDPGTCPAGESCGNRAFHLLPAPRLEVFLTDGKGWGVRCADALAPGTFLAEYAGEVVDAGEARRRAAAARDAGAPHFYMMEAEADRVIDAGPKGNVARLLNSSCDPNCVAQKWRDAATGEMRVGLFTARQVPAGEELVYNYNFQQFQGGTERGEYACRCGAPNCKGSMDLRALARDPGARESGAAGERGGAEGEMQSPAGRRAGAKEAAAVAPRPAKRRRGPSRPRKRPSSPSRKENEPGGLPAAVSLPPAPGGGLEVGAGTLCAPPAAGPLHAVPGTPAEASPRSGARLCSQARSPLLPRSMLAAAPTSDLPAAARKLSTLAARRPAVRAWRAAVGTWGAPLGPSILTTPVDWLQGGDLGLVIDAAGPPVALAAGFLPRSPCSRRPPPLRPGSAMHALCGRGARQGTGACRRHVLRLCAAPHPAAHARPAAGGPSISARPSEPTRQSAPSPSAARQAQEPDPQVPNPGAEAVAGRFHGNGAPARSASASVGEAPAAAARPSRRVRKPRRRFGESDGEASDADQRLEEGEGTPPRAAAPATAPSPGMSPATQAAATIASLLGGPEAAPAQRHRERGAAPPAPVPAPRANAAATAAAAAGLAAGGGARQRSPTPASTGLPARTILVAKKLTNSDVTKGRILLPRAAVEANLSFAVGRAHLLAAEDAGGRRWEFTLQSWANGMESRRVYVLEHAADFIRAHALRVEDVIGISSTAAGTFLVEVNTAEVRGAAESQQAARVGQVPGGAAAGGGGVPGGGEAGEDGAPARAPVLAPGAANPLVQANAGRCARSPFCNKPAGHPGFCTRTAHGAAAAAAAATGGGRARAAARARAGDGSSSDGEGEGGYDDGDDDDGGGRGGVRGKRRPPYATYPAAASSSDGGGRPRRARRPSHKLAEGGQRRRGAGASSDSSNEGESGRGQARGGKRARESGPVRLNSGGGAAAPGPFRDAAAAFAPPPPAPPSAAAAPVPPIFVITDPALLVPAHLRSPLRPSMASAPDLARSGSLGGLPRSAAPSPPPSQPQLAAGIAELLAPHMALPDIPAPPPAAGGAAPYGAGEGAEALRAGSAPAGLPGLAGLDKLAAAGDGLAPGAGLHPLLLPMTGDLAGLVTSAAAFGMPADGHPPLLSVAPLSVPMYLGQGSTAQGLPPGAAAEGTGPAPAQQPEQPEFDVLAWLEDATPRAAPPRPT